MRIVFMGTPEFAVPSLCRLHDDGHEILSVFTRPDKPRGRGMCVGCSCVKEAALGLALPICHPATFADGVAAGALHGLECDIIAVVAYGRLLPREVLGIPKLGCINIHGSLLPKYRGAAPVEWAIINGETETGVTSLYMDEELDSGDIIGMKKTLIGENETGGELTRRLSVLGSELLSDTITAISGGHSARTPQKHCEATYAPRLGREISAIDWSETALAIKAKVRGLNPRPTATAKLSENIIKVFIVEATDAKTQKKHGEIVSAGKHGIEVACLDGTVIIKELQPPGGKRMAAFEYLSGRHEALPASLS